MKILYAEDEKSLSMAVAEILKMEKYEVDAVYNGAEAWEQLQANHYDVVVLDIMMPQMDGMEVLEKMRSAQIYTPVLLLTAKAQTDDRIEGLKAGADDYLAKPFAMGELLARVNAMCRRVTSYKSTILKYGNISLNCETNELKTESSLRLSSGESHLMELFLKNPEMSFSTEELTVQLGGNKKDASAVRLYISYLQTKLMQIHADRTIRQQGDKYQLA